MSETLAPPESDAGAPKEQLCGRTGLALAEHPAFGSWRVFRTANGALNGRPRPEKPLEWSRFDLPGEAVLYSSTTEAGAYAEVLAPLRPRISQLAQLAQRELGEDIPDDFVSQEWGQRGHMQPGQIPKIWWVDRSIAQLDVQPRGWFIDVEEARSLQVLRKTLASILLSLHITDFDVATVRGPSRELTCATAEWISKLVLYNGSVPQGIFYHSRLSTNDWECWAIFPYASVTCVHQHCLTLDSPALQEIATLYGLHLH